MIKKAIIFGILILCIIQTYRVDEAAFGNMQSFSSQLYRDSRHLYIVPHQDDDLLFMNPDILNNIKDGHSIATIYVTAGDKRKKASYWLGRENGVKAAYAFMAGVSNDWIEDTLEIGKYKITHVILRESPNIELVFLRLPDGIDLRKGEVTLRTIWKYNQVIIYSKDQTNMYRKPELVSLLRTLISNYKPTSIGYIFPGIHEDHQYVGKFAELAIGNNSYNSTIIKYRDYNINTSPPNLNQFEAHLKWTVAQIYGQHDKYFPKLGNEKFYKKYYNWCQRQYYYEERSFATHLSKSETGELPRSF
ncbi:MAG TPA: PIG-L family deacetylase [Bacillota bacterium]|nr:PIG-L family deacetylase [Bacillota bacterium]